MCRRPAARPCTGRRVLPVAPGRFSTMIVRLSVLRHVLGDHPRVRIDRAAGDGPTMNLMVPVCAVRRTAPETAKLHRSPQTTTNAASWTPPGSFRKPNGSHPACLSACRAVMMTAPIGRRRRPWANGSASSIAIVSVSLGAAGLAVTRYLVTAADPVTLAILRWGIGFLCVLPVALLMRAKWPQRSDWPAVAALGIAFYGLFFVLYNIAMAYTTAARASLALSTLAGADHGGRRAARPGAALGAQDDRRPDRGAGRCGRARLGTWRAPAGAWRGELIMTGAVLCMAFYNVWSRPFIQRSSALGFLAVGMGAGAAVLIAVGLVTGPRRGARHVRRAAMDRRHLSRRRRRRARLHSLGAWRWSALRRRGSPTP